ncbi:hypothetical protein [Acinetobacter sp.]|uniref:hypothetical protein n=1 Tax=Acinetobacter sp. TaxID=472 RepID=UPI00388D4503
MTLIADSDGVDVIISPVTEKDGFQVNLDFNFAQEKLDALDNRCRYWNIELIDGRRKIGTAEFSAFQFIADGVERRTIALKSITIAPRHRGQKRSYDVMQFVIDTVARECDRDWGPVSTAAVVFIEKRDMSHLPEKDRNAFFDFLKKIGEKILGVDPKDQPSGDLSVSVIGDQISMQLIQGHLVRSHALPEVNKR